MPEIAGVKATDEWTELPIDQRAAGRHAAIKRSILPTAVGEKTFCGIRHRVVLSSKANGRFTHMINEDFVQRLKHAFDNATMADIARRIDVPHATIRNYFQGRLPAPEVLIKIASETNVSLNWLLLGAGEMYMRGAEPIDLGRIIDRRIEEIVDRRLAERAADVVDLGTIDEQPVFDVSAAVRELGDPGLVMSEWFRHEGREYPADFGVVFFQGWESYSPAEKVEAVRDAKKVLDRTLRNAAEE